VVEPQHVPELVRGDESDREALLAPPEPDATGRTTFASPGCGSLTRSTAVAWPESPCVPDLTMSSASPWEARSNLTGAPLRVQARTAWSTAHLCSGAALWYVTTRPSCETCSLIE
jgi:hypothetical protein